LHHEVRLVGERIHDQSDLIRVDQPGTIHERGRGAATNGNAIQLEANRFAKLASIGDTGRTEGEREHLVGRSRVAGQRDKIQRRIAAEGRKLALGLKADHVWQLIDRCRRQRHEFHLDVIAADTDQRGHFSRRLLAHGRRQPRADLLTAQSSRIACRQ
jgi:hypothetical protein